MLEFTHGPIAGDVPTQFLRGEAGGGAIPRMDILVYGTSSNTEKCEALIEFCSKDGYDTPESLGQASKDPAPQSPLLGRE